MQTFRAALEAAEVDNTELAAERLRRCLELSPENPICAYHLACLHAKADPELGLEWLRRAISWGYVDAAVMAWDPDLAPLRGPPGFASALDSIEAPELDSRQQTELWIGDSVTRPHFSPDDRRVVYGGATTVRDVEENEILEVFLQLQSGGWDSHHFTADGERLVIFSRTGVWVCDAATYQLIHMLPGTLRGRGFLSPDGASALTETRDGEFLRWDLLNGQLDETLSVVRELGSSVIVNSRCNKLIVCNRQKKPSLLLDAYEGDLMVEFPDLVAESGVLHASFSADCEWLATIARSGKVDVWKANSGQHVRRLPLEGLERATLRFVGEGGLLVVADKTGELTWWDVDSGVETHRVSTEEAGLQILDVSRGGRLLLLYAYKAAVGQVWDALEHSLLWELRGDKALQWSYSTFSEGGMYVPVQKDYRRTLLLDAWTGRHMGSLGKGGLRNLRQALSPDASLAASGCSDGTVRLWATSTGETLQTFYGHEGLVNTVVFNPDGRLLASGSDDSTCRLWTVTGPEPTLTLQLRGRVNKAVFSPSGGLLVVAAWNAEDQTADVRVCEVQTGEFVTTLSGHGGWVLEASWSPSGEFLATACGDGMARVWKTDTWELAQSFDPPQDVRCLAFHPQEEYLAVGCKEGQVLVFSLATGETVADLDGNGWTGTYIGIDPGSLGDIEFHPDGDLLLAANNDRMIHSWRWKTGARAWIVSFSGGTMGTESAEYVRGGREVLIHGQHSLLLDSEGGGLVEDLPKLGWAHLAADGRLFGRGGVILGGRPFRRLGGRVECRDGGYVVHEPGGYFLGTLAAAKWSQVVLGDGAYPLDGYAPLLYDPKRVRASLAGIEVLPPDLCSPPQLELDPPDRFVEISGDSFTLRGRAEDPLGVLRFEVEQDGTPVSSAVLAQSTEIKGTTGTLVLEVSMPDGTSKSLLRVRAANRRGVACRARLLTLVRP